MPTLTLSESALDLLRRRLATKDATVTPANLAAYRELAKAGIMDPCSTFVGGKESLFRFTTEGWERRGEIIADAAQAD